MSKNLNEVNFIPGNDPQDGGFDVFVNYVSTRDPTSSEPLIYNGYPFLPLWWQNASSNDSWLTYSTNNFWLCVNNTSNNMVWWKIVFDNNILSILNSKGWKLNTNRSYISRSSPSFSTSYTPSTTNDTQVIVNCQTISVTGGNSTVSIQINNGSGFITISTQGVSGVVSTIYPSLSFIVPSNSQYQVISSVSGIGSSATINSINELSL